MSSSGVPSEVAPPIDPLAVAELVQQLAAANIRYRTVHVHSLKLEEDNRRLVAENEALRNDVNQIPLVLEKLTKYKLKVKARDESIQALEKQLVAAAEHAERKDSRIEATEGDLARAQLSSEQLRSDVSTAVRRAEVLAAEIAAERTRCANLERKIALNRERPAQRSWGSQTQAGPSLCCDQAVQADPLPARDPSPPPVAPSVGPSTGLNISPPMQTGGARQSIPLPPPFPETPAKQGEEAVTAASMAALAAESQRLEARQRIHRESMELRLDGTLMALQKQVRLSTPNA